MNEYVRLDEVTKIIEEQIRKRNCLEMGGTDRTVLNVLQVVKTRIWKLDIVEAEPVRHAYWKDLLGCGYTVCSACDFIAYSIKDKYCPNCGAKMDGGAGNDRQGT